MPRLENLLGAQALGLTDRLLGADDGGPPPSDRAALVTLLAHPDRPVAWLGDVLGLTSSGSTRLVDRLVAAGWVIRTAGTDARSRRLRLTDEGHRRASAILQARQSAMGEVVAALSQEDRGELERLLGLVVRGLAETASPMRVCRLCDRASCASGGLECPLEQGERADV
jgi:DNA-binding MarR family transcriptional regulator